MSNIFRNDHSVKKALLSKILKITPGGFHCWCDSNVGIVRKNNNEVPDFLWDKFHGIKSRPIVSEPMIPIIRTENPSPKKWYQRLWNWIIKKLPGNVASGVKSR